MNNADNSLSQLAALLHQRLVVVGALAASLDSARLNLLRNGAKAIARGAAHQAELCRQWSQLEEQLRAQAPPRLNGATLAGADEPKKSAQLEEEWQGLRKRLGYLTRVHWSLLRHMQRSLGIVQRVVDSCAPTYTPQGNPGEPRLSLRAGE